MLERSNEKLSPISSQSSSQFHCPACLERQALPTSDCSALWPAPPRRRPGRTSPAPPPSSCARTSSTSPPRCPGHSGCWWSTTSSESRTPLSLWQTGAKIMMFLPTLYLDAETAQQRASMFKQIRQSCAKQGGGLTSKRKLSFNKRSLKWAERGQTLTRPYICLFFSRRTWMEMLFMCFQTSMVKTQNKTWHFSLQNSSYLQLKDRLEKFSKISTNEKSKLH